ncbi:MAG TPA: cysteine desulfurase NifS [Candidatus Negativibacillus faecipullorum]|nr:cysteine desulfurase NifS [Candidatus Negativibacillus faecipullorum]
MEQFVYADNAATTKLSPAVLEAMMPYLTEEYGNPSSLYRFGNHAKRAIEQARKEVADVLGAEPFEILFTGGGTEADNWVKEIMRSLKARGKNHFITSAVEHHALLHSAQRLQKEGFEVTFIPVDREGQLDPEQVRAAIRPETGLVSIMFANNEIGTIYPIKEIGAICRQAGVLFHTDAVQAAGHLPINVKEMNIDLLSLSAHKFHGPKGVGAFYCRRGIPLPSLIDGGAQERGKRAGTENVAGIVGLGAALRLANEEMSEASARVSAMRDRLIDGILQTVPMCRLNGPRHNRLPGNCNISFLGIEGESLLLRLDLAGIAASSGSACASSSLDPSHVLLAIGLPHEVAHGSVRLSLSDYNTEEDVDYILEKLPEIVSTLRSMSPLWEQIQKGQIHYDI